MLFAGAGVAMTAGLLLGAAMKPDLAADDRPAGPQIFVGGSATRATERVDDATTVASYSGQVPDYVLGTDWRKLTAAAPAAVAEPRAARLSPPESVRDEPLEPQLRAGDLTPAVYSAAPLDHVAYPSLDGAAAYQDASHAEATPVAAPADLDRDAPPEAAVDIARAR